MDPQSDKSEHPERHFLHLIAIPASIIPAVLFIGTIYWLYARYQSLLPDGVVCTQEAMQCPDGSYVGRVGPKCEFAECPSGESRSTNQELREKIDISTWQTYRNEEYGFEVRYPKTYYLHPPSTPNDDSFVLLFKTDENAEAWVGRVALLVQDTEKKNIQELGSLMNAEYITLGPYEALKLSPDTPPFTEFGYIFIHNGKEYDFQVIGANQDRLFDMEQILSTFKFIP